MPLQDLDFYFPFIVFFYGLVILLLLYNPLFLKLAEKHLTSSHYEQFLGRLWLGWICLCVGGFWSLQNLIFAS